jgi:Flp pilus assembly pilin Flp
MIAIVDRVFAQSAAALYGVRGEEGQSLAEFALIIALVALLCVASLTVVKGGISKALDAIASSL